MKTRTVNVFSYLWQSVKTRWNGFFEHYKIKTAAGSGGLRTLFRGERRLFRPAVPGRSAPQHDVIQYEGMAKDISDMRAATGEDPQWTGGMFGGMPA